MHPTDLHLHALRARLAQETDPDERDALQAQIALVEHTRGDARAVPAAELRGL